MNKRYLTKRLLGIIIILYGVISALFYYAANYQIKHTPQNQIQEENDGSIGAILDEKKVVQSFHYDGDYLQRIALKVGTYARKNTGRINVSLYDAKDELLWKEQKEASKLEDNSDWWLNVNKRLSSGMQEYYITIESEGFDDDNNITIYTNSKGSIHNGQLYVGDDLVEAELEMALYGGKKRKFAFSYWLICIVLLVIIVAVYGVEVQKEKKGKRGWLSKFCYTLDTYQFMLKQLVNRDFKTKYKRSVLGMFWSLLNPLLTMVVQYIVFSTVFRGNVRNFPVYLLSGSILFNFFTESVGGGLSSIVGNASLITKVNAPKYIYPVTKVLSTSINLVISMLPMLAVVLITGEKINKAYLLIPFVAFCLLLFAMGMTLILSSLMVFFRDVQFLWSIISLLWLYATPLFYPASIIPEKFHFILAANPMYHYVTFFRSILLDYTSPALIEYVFCLGFSIIFCVIGGIIFNRTEKKFVLYL